MAKHTAGKKGKSSSDVKKEENLKKWEKLYPKSLEHVEESLKASIPCFYCDKDGNSVKRDKDNKCLVCHGAGEVPDTKRRDWAAEEVNSRVAPKPKPMEITIDEKSDFEEFEKEVSEMPKDQLDKLAKDLGIVFNEDLPKVQDK